MHAKAELSTHLHLLGIFEMSPWTNTLTLHAESPGNDASGSFRASCACLWLDRENIFWDFLQN